MKTRGIAAAMIVVVGGLGSGVAWGQDLPETAGVLGLASETGAGWLAVRVAVPSGQALAGVTWFNNDDLVVFPRVLVASGEPAGPGDVAAAEVVAEGVAGQASAWSSLAFSTPVASVFDALYVVFAFDEGTAYSEPGSGGGSALGYLAAATGTRGWLSGDGATWIGLDPACSFAVMPEYVPYVPGMLVKSLDGEVVAEPDVPPVAEPYLAAGPNPFNPVISLRFGLVTAGRTRIDVIDLRGRNVAQLIDEWREAGHHVVSWDGADGRGCHVASGVYFIRLAGPDGSMSKRVTVVR